jgi:hypothetical protein
MGKKTAFLHVGPPVPGLTETHELLTGEAEALAEAGLAVPPVAPARMFHASVELLRTHKEQGLRRRHVEGAWAEACRTAERCRSDVLVSLEELAGASPAQAALALDGLAAFRVHVVLTPVDPAEVVGLDTWVAQVKPGRLHVVPVAEGDRTGLVTALVRLARREREARVAKEAAKLERRRRRRRRLLEAG